MPATSDHPALAEPRDVAARVAEAREHLVRVLAERRGWHAERGRRGGELARVHERRPAGAPAVVHLDHHLAVAEPRILNSLAERRDRPDADVEGRDAAQPLIEPARA